MRTLIPNKEIALKKRLPAVQEKCLWIIGDPKKKNSHTCGKDQLPGKPYCKKHCSKAYAPTEPSQKMKKKFSGPERGPLSIDYSYL